MPKQVFKDFALFFLKVKNQASQLNMQIKLSYEYFDHEGHNPRHTRYNIGFGYIKVDHDPPVEKH